MWLSSDSNGFWFDPAPLLPALLLQTCKLQIINPDSSNCIVICMNVECDIEIFFFKFKEEEEVGGEAERSRGTVEEQRRRIVARRPIENPVYTVRQKFQAIFFFLADIFKVMNQGATNGEGQGGRRPFQTPPIHQRTFSGDVGAPVPKQRYFNNPGKKAKVPFSGPSIHT